MIQLTKLAGPSSSSLCPAIHSRAGMAQESPHDAREEFIQSGRERASECLAPRVAPGGKNFTECSEAHPSSPVRNAKTLGRAEAHTGRWLAKPEIHSFALH
jgi:hypothetical protein